MRRFISGKNILQGKIVPNRMLQNSTIKKKKHTYIHIYLIVDGNLYSFYFPFGHLKKE